MRAFVVRERLLTPRFVLASAASFLQGLALHVHLHLPGFLHELGADEAEIGMLSAAMAAIAIVSRPTVGRVMDQRGRRIVLLAGGALHVAVCLAYLTVTKVGVLVAALRGAHGIAEAMLFSGLFTYAADIIPAARRTQGLAVFGVSGLLPIALGGLIGDWVLARGSYRELFLLSAAFALLGTLCSLPLRDQRIAADADQPARSFFTAVFDRPLLPLWFIGTVFATSLSSLFVFVKTFVLQTGYGSVGLFFGVYAVAASLLRLLFGWVPDRIGPKRALYPAILLLACGLVILALARSDAAVAASGLVSGLGHGFAFPILAGLVVTRARASERGSAISLFTAVFDFGLLIGGPLFGAVAQTASYAFMYALSASLCVGGAALFAVLDRGQR